MSTLMIDPKGVTHESAECVHAHRFADPEQALDRMRSALSERLTARLSGKGDKEVALMHRRHRTTVQRWFRGEAPTSYERFLQDLRKKIAGGTFPVAALADATAIVWSESLRGMPLAEKRARLRALMRDEERATHAMNLWQQDYLDGIPFDLEEAAEAVLTQAIRTIQIYALLNDIAVEEARVA